jgi:hypothetical protein
MNNKGTKGGGLIFRRDGSAVAQVGNLLFRRLIVGWVPVCHTVCGLPIRDTAECHSALPLRAALRYFVPWLQKYERRNF